jgi:carboxypeptidase family protein
MPVHFEVEKEGFAFAPELGATPWRALWVIGGNATQFDLVMRRAASLAGTVTGPDGPVSGAEVVADVWNPVRGSLPSRTTTDATGAFRFGGLPEGRARVVASRSGYVQIPSPGEGWRTGTKPDARTVVEIPRSGEARIDLRVERGAMVTGRVVSGGRPVAMALVAAVSGEIRRETTTGAGGDFVLAGLRTDAPAKLHVVRDGFVDADAEVRASQEPAGPLEIVMEPLGTARGRVVGPDGGAVDGAWVQIAPAKLALDAGYEVLSVWHRAERVSVAPDGSFDAPIAWFQGASADGIVVRAGAPGLAPAISRRLAPPRSGSVDAGTLNLEAGHRLEGRVLAADGSGPVAGAKIEFMNETLPPALGQRRDWSTVGRDQTPFEWVARTGSDGTFAIEGLPPWRYELRVNAEGFDGAGPTVAVPQEKPALIELKRLLTLSGRVETEDGAGAPGVIVMAIVPGHGAVDQTETREGGAFEFRWIPDGRYLLEARRAWDVTSDLVAAQLADVEAGRRDVTIVMRRAGGTISGRCATSSGAAVPGAVIRLKPPKGTPILLARSAADGRFTVAGLEDGPWAITADANRSVGAPEGFGKKLVAQARDVAVGAVDLYLEFREAVPITGRVLRADRTPAKGQLTVHAKLVGGVWTLMCPLREDGAFRFDNATPGTWTLTVVDTANAATLRTLGPSELVAPRADVELVLGGDQALAGRVVDADGRAVANALVSARSAGGAVLPATVTDRDGRFQWTSAAEGPWTVAAGESATGRAEVAGVSAGTTDVALTLRADTTVTALLHSGSDAPIRGALVTLHAEGGAEVEKLRTDSEGRFTTKALRAGTYEVRLVERDGRAVAPPRLLGSVASGAASAVLRLAAD